MYYAAAMVSKQPEYLVRTSVRQIDLQHIRCGIGRSVQIYIDFLVSGIGAYMFLIDAFGKIFVLFGQYIIYIQS